MMPSGADVLTIPYLEALLFGAPPIGEIAQTCLFFFI
jgi:hypothetical protein